MLQQRKHLHFAIPKMMVNLVLRQKVGDLLQISAMSYKKKQIVVIADMPELTYRA